MSRSKCEKYLFLLTYCPLRSPTKKININLHHEFAEFKFGDRVSIETLDTNKSSGRDPYAVVVGETNKHRIYLQVKFPPGYAYFQEPPRFSMITGTTLDQATGFKIQHKVQKEAERLTLREEPCLESCFRVFEQEIEHLFNQEKEEVSARQRHKNQSFQFVALSYKLTPFPRTCDWSLVNDANQKQHFNNIDQSHILVNVLCSCEVFCTRRH